MELDQKLVKFLRAVRTKGGVINIHVVRAAATALIASNPSTAQHLLKVELPHSWVQSIIQAHGVRQKEGWEQLHDLQYLRVFLMNAECNICKILI